MGTKTLIYYVTTSCIAVMIGLVLVNVIQPGVSNNPTPVLEANAAAEGQMLGLIFFSLLFGYFVTQIKKRGVLTSKEF